MNPNEHNFQTNTIKNPNVFIGNCSMIMGEVEQLKNMRKACDDKVWKRKENFQTWGMHLHDMMQREMDLKNIFVLFYIQIQNKNKDFICKF